MQELKEVLLTTVELHQFVCTQHALHYDTEEDLLVPFVALSDDQQ